MTKENLIGTWKCTKEIEDGVEKVKNNSKITISFTDDGFGKLKILFIPLKFHWTFENDQLTMTNVSTGEKLDAPIEVQDDCIIIKNENSTSYFYKD